MDFNLVPGPRMRDRAVAGLPGSSSISTATSGSGSGLGLAVDGLPARSRSSTSTSTRTTSALPTSRPSASTRPSLKDYHASLSTHLSSILREEISGSTSGGGFPLDKPVGEVQNTVQPPAQVQVRPLTQPQPQSQSQSQAQPQPQPQGKMYTDLKALAERDKEHLTAWYLEGYKRYIGGVNEGFVLLRGDDQDPIKDPRDLDMDLGLDMDQTTRGRKRRYTEEPGLLERRRKVLRMSLEQGRLDAVKTQRSGSADERLRQEARARSGAGTALGSKEEHEQGEVGAGHYISPLITPGLAFVPTPFEEMNTNPQRAGGMNFGQAVGRKSMAMSSGGSSGGSITGNHGNHGGFNLGQPPANRGALEERRMRKRAMTGSSSGSGSMSTSMSISGSGSGSGSRGARQWVSPTLTMTNMTSKAKRPTMPSTPSTGSLAFVSASHLNIALPSGSSPVYMADQHQHQHHQQQQQHQQHIGRPRQDSMADAALGTTSSAGLTSLTAASLGCRAHEGLTGGSSGLLAGAHLAMTEMGTPAASLRQKDFDDEKSLFARECGFDPVTPGFLPAFGMGEEMAHGDPRDAVEISSPAMPPDYSSHAFAQRPQGASGHGLGLVDEMMSKARPTMLQRATSSYLNPERWSLPTPGSEGTTPVDVAWDKWLRADDDTPAPTS